jgi:hypothetical protein
MTLQIAIAFDVSLNPSRNQLAKGEFASFVAGQAYVVADIVLPV